MDCHSKFFGKTLRMLMSLGSTFSSDEGWLVDVECVQCFPMRVAEPEVRIAAVRIWFFSRMGSFSSTPKIEHPDSQDDDIIPTFRPSSQQELFDRCRNEIESCGRPPLLVREFRRLGGESAFVRVLQWNVLSQCKDTEHRYFQEE